MRTGTLLVTITGLFLAGCGRSTDFRAQQADAEPLHLAVRQLTDVIVYDIFSPPQASRTYAYASIAAYEAMRHDHPEYLTLAGQVNGLEPVPAPDPDAELYLPLAGVHALMTVGKALTFSQERMDSLRTEMHRRFRSQGVPAPVFERSVAYGDQVAQHVLAWASEDYFLQLRGYPKFSVSRDAGRWIPTPPAYMDAVEPNWGRVRPFVMDSASQFRPKPPLPYDMTEGSPFHAQVREVLDTGTRLTEEQRAIAAFWDCNPYVMNVRGHAMFATKKITPGGHWINIVSIVSRSAGADLMRSVEAYARTSVALADGFISSWEEKFRSNLVRPETVINEHLDERWEPLLQTPPFPEYTSGHSVISNAAAVVLTDLFGEAVTYQDDTLVPWGLPPRSFTSFGEASAEAAVSRMYGGIHYRMAIEEGTVQGRRVGEHVLARVRTRANGAVAQHAAARP
jgi:hypothetical protein